MKRSIHLLAAAVLAALLTSPSASVAKDGEGKDDVRHVDGKEAVALVAEKAKQKDGDKEEKAATFVVLDVRTPKEFAEGHIEGARNVDFQADDFAEKAGKLDRKATYLVHCRSGRRSTASLEVLRKLGFENLIHLDGGFLDWEKAGGKVVTAEE